MADSKAKPRQFCNVRAHTHKAVRNLEDFLVNDLSNWYVRRSRRRFWRSENNTDKKAAYSALYEALLNLSKIIAPVVPFAA